MRFVEAVSRELQNQIKELLTLLRVQPLLNSALNELRTLRIDNAFFLLADRLNQRVRAAQRDPTKLMHNLHDLFLIDHHAICFFREVIHDRVHLGNLVLPVLAPVVIRDQIHRPRTEQRVGRDQVFQPVRFHLRQQPTHPPRFKLEHPRRIPAPEHLKHNLIRELEPIQIERVRHPLALLLPHRFPDLLLRERLQNPLLRALDNRQRPQPQEIHLEQTHHLAGRPIPLRNHILAARLFIQRHNLMQRTRRNDHPRRMHRRVPRLTLKGPTRINDPLHSRILVVPVLEIRLLLKRLLKRDPKLFRDQLRELVRIPKRELHHTRHIADRGASLERTKGNDLRHMPILLAHILDHLPAPILAQVDINIGILRPVRIGKPLKQQPIMHRTRIG